MVCTAQYLPHIRKVFGCLWDGLHSQHMTWIVEGSGQVSISEDGTSAGPGTEPRSELGLLSPLWNHQPGREVFEFICCSGPSLPVFSLQIKEFSHS